MSPSLNKVLHYSASNLVMRSTVRFLLRTAPFELSYRDIMGKFASSYTPRCNVKNLRNVV